MTALEFSYSVNQLSPSLKPMAMRLTRDVEDANDLIQETVLKAFTNRDKFSDGTNLKAWMYTILKNTFITNYQRMVRRNTFIDTTDNLHFINSSGNSVENSAYSKFTNEDIERALDKLDETFKTPFMMYFKGFKYYEIADRLNIPLGTVKNRIHIARKELQHFLKIYKN